MSDYTPSQEQISKIIDEAFSLSRADRIILFQKMFFAFISHDKKVLIPLLQKAGVTTREIAKALGVDESRITKDFPLGK